MGRKYLKDLFYEHSSDNNAEFRHFLLGFWTLALTNYESEATQGHRVNFRLGCEFVIPGIQTIRRQKNNKENQGYFGL